jgi:hypothetical protein
MALVISMMAHGSHRRWHRLISRKQDSLQFRQVRLFHQPLAAAPRDLKRSQGPRFVFPKPSYSLYPFFSSPPSFPCFPSPPPLFPRMTQPPTQSSHSLNLQPHSGHSTSSSSTRPSPCQHFWQHRKSLDLQKTVSTAGRGGFWCVFVHQECIGTAVSNSHRLSGPAPVSDEM